MRHPTQVQAGELALSYAPDQNAAIPACTLGMGRNLEVQAVYNATQNSHVRLAAGLLGVPPHRLVAAVLHKRGWGTRHVCALAAAWADDYIVGRSTEMPECLRYIYEVPTR